MRRLVSLASSTVAVGQPPRTLVKDLNLKINQGERWAILGANGCGKSTTVGYIGRQLSEKHDAAFISFEHHRKLLRDESKQFQESRFTVVHKRATVASYLFPELYPDGSTLFPELYQAGYTPEQSRLSPIPVPYDAGKEHPSLAELEHATCTGQAGWLLNELELLDLRHQPVHGLSTGEGRKLMLVQCLLAPSSLLVLDEAFDGLDERSRHKLQELIQSVLQTEPWHQSALAMITHRHEDYEGLAPSHALLLGQGEDNTEYTLGEWGAVQADVATYFESQHQENHWSPPAVAPLVPSTEASLEPRDPLIEFNQVSIRYPTSVVFQPPLSWTVREGEKWVVAGSNGSGKSTLLEIVTGENVLAYQQDVTLFGRRKGSGESVWEIKQQLGEISTEFHMNYIDFADPSVRTFANKPSGVSTWEVVCSGFFDSMGLYEAVNLNQEDTAREWVQRLGICDLVTAPARGAKPNPPGLQNFFRLSHGEQKLVLLCRAMVKGPRLLLLDEPTHGLSGHNRHRLLHALCSLAKEPDVAIVYVTHRSDEVAALEFENVLQLGDRTTGHCITTAN